MFPLIVLTFPFNWQPLTTSLDIFFLKAFTVLRGPLAYPNGLLDLHIETFW